MDHSLRRTYCIFRIVIALMLPPGGAYCEDALPAGDCALTQKSSALDERTLQAAGKSEPLPPNDVMESQGKELRVLLCWRLDEPMHGQGSTQSAPHNEPLRYTMQARSDAYADAFNTMSRLFRQVAMIAQTIKGNIDRGIAPVTQSVGSGFALGMHAPADFETGAGLKYSGIFSEKNTSHFEPCFSVTFIFGS